MSAKAEKAGKSSELDADALADRIALRLAEKLPSTWGTDVDRLADRIAACLAEKPPRETVAQPAPEVAGASPLAERDRDVAREALAAARLFGSDAIRFAFLVNGGALTALLAYLGSGNAPGPFLAWAIAAFAAGAIAAFCAALFAYWAQSDLADRYHAWKATEALPKSRWSVFALGFLCICALLAASGTVLAFLEMQGAADKRETVLELKILQK